MFSETSASTVLTWGDPFAFKTTSDSEMRLKNRDSRDPEQGPPPEPGDSYLFIASIAGIIIGGALGFYIAVKTAGPTMIFIGVIAGCLAGGIIGSYIGSYLKRRKREESSRLPRDYEKGPFTD